MRTLKSIEASHQRKTINSWNDVDILLGNDFYSLDGIKISRGERIDDKGRLPVVLDNGKMLSGDLIPSTSWGASLANLLTKKSWDMLRHPIISRNNNVCEICGTQHKILDVHEIWSYWTCNEDERKLVSKTMSLPIGIQRLDGLLGICHECHKCFHLGKANADGEIDMVIARLSRVNGWSQSEGNRYFHTVSRRWQALSKYHWVLDFSGVEHPDGFLTVKSPWRRDDRDGRFLTAPNRFGDPSITAIVEHPWCFSNDDETTFLQIRDL